MTAALVATAALTVGVGATSASASSPCSHVAVSDKSNGVVETVRTGALAHLEPAGECTDSASIKGLVKLNAWCYTYNYYGNYWVNVGTGRWIYAADYLVLVSGTVNHC
ncbi:hypothetical protein [Actinacidiphila epipremni]|uniref:SH3 domain-containing protein n=1 Tax=Actinacidiphila epipremni TaxID=2053013 RepID=A0ABX0ZJG9_9ACTN|nr:hypothetical protein [Actinacidiphila epipremni]NJP43915.1 hypothetical protein [Actinacidiphila epipremni]